MLFQCFICPPGKQPLSCGENKDSSSQEEEQRRIVSAKGVFERHRVGVFGKFGHTYLQNSEENESLDEYCFAILVSKEKHRGVKQDPFERRYWTCSTLHNKEKMAPFNSRKYRKCYAYVVHKKSPDVNPGFLAEMAIFKSADGGSRTPTPCGARS